MTSNQRFDGFPKTMYTSRTRSALSGKGPKSNSAMSTRTYSRIRGSADEGRDIERGLRKSMTFEGTENSYAGNVPTTQEMENERELLQRMIDQQKQLQDLQERQKRILDLQHQLASMDQSAGDVMEEKLSKLQAAKSRLDELQKLVGTIKSAESPEKRGAGDNIAKRINDKNQRIRMALDELSDLKSLINMMSISQYQNSDSSAVVKPVFPNTINNADEAESEESYRPVLPEVSVVQQDEEGESDEENKLSRYFRKSPVGKPARAKEESTPLKPAPQLLDPFYNQRKSQKKKKTQRKGKRDSEVSEQLYSEMQRHQTLLKELRERRKELEDLMNMTKGESERDEGDYNDANDSTRSNLGSPDDSRGFSDADVDDFETSQSGRLFGLNESDTRRLIDIIRNQKSLGATTEKTTATWGSSSSGSDDSDDEKTADDSYSRSMGPPKEVVDAVLQSKDDGAKGSPGPEEIQESLSLLQEAKELYDQRSGAYRGEHEIDFRPPTRRRQTSAQPRKETAMFTPAAWKTTVEKLQDDLSGSNNTMHLLLEDQQALTRLLQNTLNLQQNSFSNNMCYGISPDFLIYQLDNCSAQFAALQKETKALQWQLYDLTKNPPSGFNRSSAAGIENRATAALPYEKLQLDFLGRSKAKDATFEVDEAPVPSDWNVGANADGNPVLDESVSVTALLSEKRDGATTAEKDDNGDLFEALRDSIYSEAAILISQNESRPHFLIELFHNLQKLNTDYLRQHCLYVLQDVMKGYLPNSPRKKTNGEKYSPNEKAPKDLQKPSFSENTPSESAATSEDELYAKLKAKASADGGYDFSMKVSSASELSTPSGDELESNPFAAEDLGSTVIHLDAALRHMREMERMKQEISSSAAGNNMEDTQASRGDAPKTGEVAQINTKLLRARIKHIVSEVIPILKNNREKTLNDDFLKSLQEKVVQIVAQTTRQNDKKPDEASNEDAEDKENLTNFFSGQLNSILEDSLQKFLGQRVGACGEDLVIGLSEVLFNELAFYHMMQDLGATRSNVPKIKVDQEEDAKEEDLSLPVEDEDVTNKEQQKEDDSDSSTTNDDGAAETQEGSPMSDTKLGTADKDSAPVTVDLSVSETQPLTSYGSGEDEEDGSGDDFTYKETDVPTSMQHDQDADVSQEVDGKFEVEGEEEPKQPEESKSSSESGSDKD